MWVSCFFLIALSVASTAAAAPAARVEMVYALTRNGSVLAEVQERLEHDGGTYRISAQWSGRGLGALRGDSRRASHGAIVPGGLRPAEFEEHRTGRDPAFAWFDWNAKTLTMQYKSVRQTQPMPPNAHDRLSFLYAFAFRPPPTQDVALSIVDGRGISIQVYRPAGREKLVTPAGEFETLKLAKRKDGPEDRDAEIWLAIGRGMLPVRILVIEKDGTRIDQVATRIAER